MTKVLLDNIEPGAVLDKDLKKDGRMLLPAGVALSDTHISMLQRMEINEVDIREPEEDADEQTLQQAADYVREFFLFVDNNHPAMITLFELATMRVAQRIISGWELPTEEELRAKSVEHLRDTFFKGECDVQDVVKAETDVASFPDIYFKIRDVLEQPNVAADDIAKVVSTDVGLSAKLLQIVNSPFYGFPSTIDSVTRAVALVGAKELSTLALGLSTINYFKDIPPELIDMRIFWRHSISCGIFAKLLGSRLGIAPEIMFTAGLLHDVGKLIHFKKMPYASVQAMLFARDNYMPMVDSETVILGFNHTDVAFLLLKEWNFPESLSRIIAWHHSPLGSENVMEACLLQLADNMTNATEIAEGGMYVIPGMEEGAWEKLGLSEGDLIGISREYDEMVDEVFNVFFS